jgi:hypothetical protein
MTSRSIHSPVTLWTLTDGEKLASCEVAFVPIGVKAAVMRNGELLYSESLPVAMRRWRGPSRSGTGIWRQGGPFEKD